MDRAVRRRDVRGQTAGVLECVHLAMQRGASALDAAIVTAPDDLALVHEHGADGDAAFAQAELRFFDRRL